MTKKVKYFLYLLCFALLFIVKIEIPYADFSGSTGGGGSGSACSGRSAGCYWYRSGIRITLVDAIGERCHYKNSGGSYEICTSDKSGNALGSIDLWFSTDLGKLTSMGSGCKYWSGRQTKQEFLKSPQGSWQTCGTGMQFRVVEDVFNTYSFSGWQKAPSGYETKRDNPQNAHFLWEWLNCEIDPKGDSAKKTGCSRTTPNLEPLARILNTMIYNNPGAGNVTKNNIRIDAQGNGKSNLYIQFDQLVGTGVSGTKYDTSGMGKKVYFGLMENYAQSVLGTVAEVEKHFINANYHAEPNYHSYNATVVGYVYAGTDFIIGSADKNGFMAGFYDNATNPEVDYSHSTSEIVSLSSISSLTALPVPLPSYSDKYYSPSKLKTRAKFLSTDANTANVMRLWLDPMGGCGQELTDLINSSKSLATKKTEYARLKTKYASEPDFKDFFNTWEYEDVVFWYNNGVNLTCEPLECIDKAQAIYKGCGRGGTCRIGGVDLPYDDALIKYSNTDGKNDFKITSSNYYKSQFNLIYINMQKKLLSGFLPSTCDPVVCIQGNVNAVHGYFLPNFEANPAHSQYFEWLADATNSDYLRASYWQPIGLGGPQCDPPSPPPCPPDTPNLSACSTSGTTTLKFADTTDTACWVDNGVAYNTISGAQSGSFIKNMTYTHSNTYTAAAGDTITEICNLYCRQEVVFNFPGEIIDVVKGGTVFKWGSGDKYSSDFGTFKISKECAVKPVEISFYEDYSCGTTLHPKTCQRLKTRNSYCNNMTASYQANMWTSSVSTSIKLFYTEATSGVIPANVKYNINGKELKISGPSNMTGFNIACNSTGSNVNPSTAKTSAEYKVDYKDDLNWYGNKDNDEPEPRNTISNDKLPWYKWLGYGVPTSFAIPNGTYGTATGDGKLYVRVSNVGDGTGGIGKHFDLAVKSISGGNSYFDYGCNFKIKNELFGDECEYDPVTGKLINGSPEYCDPEEDEHVDDDPNVQNIDVVFRTIDLINSASQINDAFPGRLGNGRTRGHNWAILTTTDIENILKDGIYSKQPIYQINLNAANINAIRNLNKAARNSGIDPYTEMKVYAYENDTDTTGQTGFYCVDNGTNKFCASRFLTYLATSAPYNKLKGTCIPSGDRTYDRALRYVASDGCAQ